MGGDIGNWLTFDMVSHNLKLPLVSFTSSLSDGPRRGLSHVMEAADHWDIRGSSSTSISHRSVGVHTVECLL